MTQIRAGRRRLQFSIRSLLIVTGLLAVLLTPAAWVARRREQMRRAHEDLLHSVLLEARYRAEQRKKEPADPPAIDGDETRAAPQGATAAPPDAAAQIQRLQRENDALRKTVESLREEIRRLNAGKR